MQRGLGCLGIVIIPLSGLLFLCATAGGIACVAFSGSGSDFEGYSAVASTKEYRLVLAMFFQLVMAFTCTGIAIAMYPVLRKYHEGLALGAVGFRLAEGILHCVNTIILMLVIVIANECNNNVNDELSLLKPVGNALLKLREWSTSPALMI